MPALFDQMDAAAMAVAQTFLAVETLLTPRRRLTLDTPPAADPDRPPVTLKGIRNEWSERVDNENNGIGESKGQYRAGVSGVRMRVTIRAADLPYPLRVGDEVTYTDRPARRYTVSELLPDGGEGLTLALNEA